VKWYQTVSDLPAVQSAWNDPALASDPTLKVFGVQLKSAKAPPAYPTWNQVAATFDTEVEKVCVAGEDPGTAMKNVQNQASSIGTGS
jgi:multiple sugar transport system substrate-binding protein